ncbi:enoyl-CoA hydratase/isomerase family protein [Acetobacter sacchari]|uniref:Enoyl-CoA hydratase/isomerase family protein n=1 Tax=Acetobacter sacchari TaxID=2661687 RepID=A0ABS3M0K3_9PROT|nr:enoyl-CoA hydratase/isomerase family protein [Acetobacter sacchari]MBO1361689.1 enoyl-CoA hydratase/isomerase family protein [Acetobacter sacchari]
MTERSLLVEVRDGVAWLTLNRPDAGNAIDIPMARELLAAAIRCDHDRAVRCVVLTGAGRMFCVGGDIASFQAAADRADDYLSELAGTMTLALSRFARMGKPLLTLVNGPAAGAGLSMAIAGDIVLAVSSAHFTSAYTAIGLVPDCGLTWWLPRVVGLRRAQELIATNRRVACEEAVAIGLVTRLVDDLNGAGAETAAALASSATAALAAARRLLLESYSASFETQSEREARAIAAAGVGDEGREGVGAFLGKRKPDFKGI